MTHPFRLLLLALVCGAPGLPAHGQLTVTLEIKRRLYVRYEPILATVRVRNLSGRDLLLRDAEQPWFGFDVTGRNTETLVPPRNIEYKLDPLEIKTGETIKRTVDLTQLYAISEFGLHRIKATIYAKELNKLFVSQPDLLEITEGRTLWQQTVGVPENLPNAGKSHSVKLLEFQDNHRYLYARVEDVDTGFVFCTYRLGHMIDGTNPQMQLDAANNLYVLHLVGPKTYRLSHIGVNGEFIGQHVYSAPKARPALRRLADGKIQIVGAHREAANIAGPDGAATVGAPVKLSERPPGLPAN